MICRILSYTAIIAAVIILTLTGNPSDSLKKQLSQLGYTEDILAADIAKGFSCGNADVGTQFLVSYGIFTRIIFFGDVLWTYADDSLAMHFIMKGNTEHTVRIGDSADVRAIAKQIEKAYPWILFGYMEEIEKLRNENFSDLEQLCTQKMFQCVIDGKLPENQPYPSSRPKQHTPPPKQEPVTPPYPSLPEVSIDEIRIPDGELSGYFAEIIRLCKEYPHEITWEFHAPVSAKEIASFEKRNKLTIPDQLKELLMFSNGFSISYDNFYSLEEIEYHHKNWGPLYDENGTEYIMTADVVGDGESIMFAKETGIFYWEDHGNFTEYGDICGVLEERTEILKDMIGAE